MSKFVKWFWGLKPIQTVVNRSKVWVIPGFRKMPLYNVVQFFIEEIQKESLEERAASVSFNFLLAIPPFFIFLLTLVPFIPLDNVEHTIYELAATLAPNENTYEVIRGILYDFLNTQRNGLLSIAFLLSFYYASTGTLGIMRSFDKHKLPGFRRRTWWQARLTALKITLFLTLLVILCVSLIIMQGSLMTYIISLLGLENPTIIGLLKSARWLLIIFLFFCIISVIYRFGPATHKKWNYWNPGSIFATLAMIVVTIGFSFWVTNFAQYNKIYGSIGTVLILMLMVYLNSFILLIGFELNTSINTLAHQPTSAVIKGSKRH
jgi:membrane protein